MLEFGYVPDEKQLSKNCCIDINGESVPIIKGHVTDPISKAKTKLEFFYLSDSDKMVHIDFEDALEEIKYSLKHHKCKIKNKRNVDFGQDHQFAYMCQKLEDLHKKIDGLMNVNKNDIHRTNEKRNEVEVAVEVHREDEDESIKSGTRINKSFLNAIEKDSPNKSIQPLQCIYPTHNIVEHNGRQYPALHVESSGELSQEEFAKYLGLTQRKAYEDSLNKTHSKKLRSKSNLTRKIENHVPPLPALEKKTVEANRKKIESDDNRAIERVEFSKLENMKTKSAKRTSKRPDYFGSPNFQTKDKAQYTTEEDKIILNWILSGSNCKKVNGNSVWHELEKKQIPCIQGRTWQSLRNRFLKNILIQLKEYGLDKNDLHKIIHGAQKGTLVRKNKTPVQNRNYGLMSTKTALNKSITKKYPASKPISGENKKKIDLKSGRQKIQDVENHNMYLDIDGPNEEALNMSYSEYKKKNKSSEKRPLVENPAYTTRSKGRKLFTQRTFIASMSSNSTVG